MANEREKLIEILRVPIYPHELADPAEVVADYLMDNDVVPVVRCWGCRHFTPGMAVGMCKRDAKRVVLPVPYNHFCSFGERRDSE